MSEKSADEEYFGNDHDSPVNRAARDDDDDAGDPEVPLRDEDENNEDEAQEPEQGEDEDDAGYGGDEKYGGEAGENRDEIADQEEEGLDEIQYTKDDVSDQGYNIYDDDEDDDKGRSRDRNRDRGSKKDKKEKRDSSRRKKKLKKNDGQEEAEEDPYAEEMEDAKEEDSKKRKGKKQVEVVKPEEVDDLIEAMKEAYKSDLIAFKGKQPAVNKLKLLPLVDASLKKNAFQNLFLQHDEGLSVLSKWLQKLPNGAPPSLQIRKKLLDIIHQLPVQEEHLRESEIGKVVYSMKNNPNEEPDLKRTIKDIIDKWTRIITDTAQDYEVSNEDIRDRKKIDVSLDEYRQRSMSSLRKSIPRLTMKKSGYDFVRKPPEAASGRSGSRQQTTENQCERIIKDMKRKIKKDMR